MRALRKGAALRAGRHLFLPACLSIVLSHPALVYGGTYFVSPLGDDLAAGSEGTPWRTIQHAAASLAPGDTVVVAAGTYAERVSVTRSGTADAPIRYQGMSGAVLVSPDPAISLSAFDVMNGVGYVVIDGFEARGGFDETIFLRQGTHDIAVRNCDIHGNRVGIWAASSTNVTIEACQVHDNTRRGIVLTDATRFVTVSETVSRDNDDGWGCFGDADGFAAEATTADITFTGCVASGNSEDGFDLQGDGIAVTRSESRNNACTGIKLWQNARVENVLVTGNGTGLTSTSFYNAATVIEIANATVANNGPGQQLFFKPPLGSPPTGYRVLLRNVIVSGPGKALEIASAVELTEDHNVFFRSDTTSAAIVRSLSATTERRYTGQEINAGVWRTETGQGTGTWAIDPEFTDLATYRVADQSIAVDSAWSAGAPSLDHDGDARPQGSAVDIGAYESAATVTDHRPWADPGPNRTKTVGTRVDFSGYGSVDPEGGELTYVWDFGDGGSATGRSASHTYAAPGEYAVMLTVSDGVLSGSRTALVTIRPAPTPSPTGSSPSSGTPSPTPTPSGLVLCGAAPRPGCAEAPRTSIDMVRDVAGHGRRNSVIWRWLRGAATTTADLGDPVTGSTRYALCIFDQNGGDTTRVLTAIPGAAEECDGCWRRTKSGGYDYLDSARAYSGVHRLTLRPGGAGKATVYVKAVGANLDIPVLPMTSTPAVVVQLISDDGACWQAVYPAPAARNTSTRFKASIR